MKLTVDTISIPVLASGKGWLAVEKPCGLSMHNLPGNDLLTVVSKGLKANGTFNRNLGADPDFGIHAPHRLDQETSGVVLLAVTAASLKQLAAQFHTRQVAKRYIALLHGELENPGGRNEGLLWQWGLTGKAGGRRFPAGKGPKKTALTRVRVLAYSRHYTQVSCEPLTGRKHQIRRHAKMAAHPVVGDRRYGSQRAISFLVRQRGFRRLALHADAITFNSPGGEKAVTIRSNGIPEELTRLFEEDKDGSKSVEGHGGSRARLYGRRTLYGKSADRG